MTDDPASLDRLHDIVLPPPVPWWPLATGWYLVLLLILIAILVLALQFLRHRRATAYRREALRLLETAADTAAVSSLLRRTALVENPRPTIAALHGSAWVDWLSAQSPAPVPATIRDQLTSGIYTSSASPDLTSLRAWAAEWIVSHRPPSA